jgi:hypothetical protein
MIQGDAGAEEDVRSWHIVSVPDRGQAGPAKVYRPEVQPAQLWPAQLWHRKLWCRAFDGCEQYVRSRIEIGCNEFGAILPAACARAREKGSLGGSCHSNDMEIVRRQNWSIKWALSGPKIMCVEAMV